MATAKGTKRKNGGDLPKLIQANRGKRARLDAAASDRPLKHSLLSQYYPRVQTLREYLLSKLPASSRIRRKKIGSLGLLSDVSEGTPHEIEPVLCRLLDTSLVGTADEQQPEPDTRWEQWMSFSQRGDESYVTLSDSISGATFSQSEIVDFAIWLLFSRKQSGGWPKHILCDGFRKNSSHAVSGRPGKPGPAIPGLIAVYPNSHISALKDDPWPQLLMLLGKSGERMMIDLLVDCAVFVPIQAGIGNLYQLSGVPISELQPLGSVQGTQQSKFKPVHASDAKLVVERTASEVSFIRSRMLYARASLNARGMVHHGLRHIHVLNRCPYVSSLPSEATLGDIDWTRRNENSTIKVMMYIFPRQFGLHNAFTSKVDFTKTAQKLQDYTLREEEIAKMFRQPETNSPQSKPHIPRRLRGNVKQLVQRLQILHSRCSYSGLLRHYCRSALDGMNRKPATRKRASHVKERGSNPSQQHNTQNSASSSRTRRKEARDRRKPRQSLVPKPNIQFKSFIELATPVSQVSAYCQAVLAKVVPNEFWGVGSSQDGNKAAVMKNIDHFIRLRRFESMSLHEVIQDLKITDIEWLAPPGLKTQKLSQTDLRKRIEILNEFLYYVFDSLLIPLIRGNFYVTESSYHRHQLFFFRHDIWRYVAEPAMAALKLKMFSEVKLDETRRILESRQLGFSQIRLLPKDTTMRPIMNLRRRTVSLKNKKILGPSINSILSPVHSMLKLEKDTDPSKLGSTMFSVGDIYERLKTFSQNIRAGKQQLYFAKVDVQSAFDTIPQDAIIEVMETVPVQGKYTLRKHVEVKSGEVTIGQGKAAIANPTRRWQSVAVAREDPAGFLERVENRLARTKKNTIFVDNVMQKHCTADSLLKLMASHIQQNLIKVGKKYYRQKNGIPQGSVLSSTLCNYFYADLEKQHLGFLTGEDCLLLRLIDDFLLITTDRVKAVKFVETMHGGLPRYGVTVSPGKTLVSFDMQVQGDPVARIPDGQKFPYCGTLIDCNTLDITKDRENARDKVVSNSLTVEFGRLPGQNFQRKVLNAFKIQSHLMFFDTTHNSSQTVFANILDAFSETATKMWAYMRCLPKDLQPAPQLIIRTIIKLIDVAFVLLKSKARRLKYPSYKCAVKKSQVTWIALHAFQKLLRRKQSAFRPIIDWLGAEIRRLDTKKDIRNSQLLQVRI